MSLSRRPTRRDQHEEKDYSYRAYQDALKDMQRVEDVFPLALDSVLNLADLTISHI